MNVKNSILVICFVVLIRNGQTERYEECLDIICPNIENDKLICPHDSKPIIIDPLAVNSPPTILWESTLTEGALSNHHPRYPRFATKSRTRREIDDHLKALCCPHKKCVCNECQVPECESKNHTAIMKESNSQLPGACCSKYECDDKPDCKTLENGYTWLEHCIRCECHDNDFFCHETCNENVVSKELNSCIEGTKVYANGVHWKRDACTNCYCNNGMAQCTLPMCPRLSCHKTIQHQNSCCPDCDKTNSSFCPGMENCGIACKHDYLKSTEGCYLCKCDLHKTTTTTTTTTTPTPSSTVITTTESPTSTVRPNEKINSNGDTIKRDSQWNTPQLVIILACCVTVIVALFIVLVFKMKNKKKYDRVDQINSNSSDTSSANIIH